MTLKDPLDVYMYTEDNFNKSNTLKVRHDSVVSQALWHTAAV